MKDRTGFIPLAAMTLLFGVEVRRNWEFESQAEGAWLLRSSPQCPFRG